MALPEKTKKRWRPWSLVGGKVENYGGKKGFDKKTSFEPGVDERRSDGW